MRGRIAFALLPAGLRFAVWAAVFAGLARVTTHHGLFVVALFATAGAAVAVGRGQPRHRALADAVTGLIWTQRSVAVDAVCTGTVPADRAVRLAAIRIGVAMLGNATADQLRRRRRLIWLAALVVVVLAIAAAASRFAGVNVLGYLMLAAVAVTGLAWEALRSWLIETNLGVLTDGVRLPNHGPV